MYDFLALCRVAIFLPFRLVELDKIVDVVAAAQEYRASLMYGRRDDVEDAPTSGGGDTASLVTSSVTTVSQDLFEQGRERQTCSVKKAMGNAS